MSERKINLEEIIDSQNIGEFKIKDYVSEDGYIHKAYKNAMLEFGKQLLELAAENVSLIEEWRCDGSKYPEDTITIYDEYNNIDRIIYPDKQSILNTIKQVD